MKILANNEFERRVFETPEEAAKHFNVSVDKLNELIESGDALGVGIRDWHFDTLLD